MAARGGGISPLLLAVFALAGIAAISNSSDTSRSDVSPPQSTSAFDRLIALVQDSDLTSEEYSEIAVDVATIAV